MKMVVLSPPMVISNVVLNKLVLLLYSDYVLHKQTLDELADRLFVIVVSSHNQRNGILANVD